VINKRKTEMRNACKLVAILSTLAFPAFAGGALPPIEPSPPQFPDPGVRKMAPGAGGPLAALAAQELDFFAAAQARFQEVDSVSGTLPGEIGIGLGPLFNMNSCAGCHAYPAIGGTSPRTNPEVKVATLDGATNTIPAFISAKGPVREPRYVLNPDGTADGSVHELFTIAGRSDANGCTTPQPDFSDAIAAGNIAFRIPTPLFGLGLVEAVPDQALNDAFAASAGRRAGLGIAGRFNVNGNDGTITRFGWKAQNKSLLLFAGEAYNVEQGVSNEIFTNEKNTDPACANPGGTPEDATPLVSPKASSGSLASDFGSDIVNFAAFARLTAPPTPMDPNTATTHGKQVFEAIGCDGCHTETLTTGASTTVARANVGFSPYSDFAIHRMGTNLADGVLQGIAAGDEFRTAPLWGAGQRLFFLHDGRTADLNQAILSHASDGSEANGVVARFNALPEDSVVDLLKFLRSL
jgi:CxxC motif-containing protein (DUF1111 family)